MRADWYQTVWVVRLGVGQVSWELCQHWCLVCRGAGCNSPLSAWQQVLQGQCLFHTKKRAPCHNWLHHGHTDPEKYAEGLFLFSPFYASEKSIYFKTVFVLFKSLSIRNRSNLSAMWFSLLICKTDNMFFPWLRSVGGEVLWCIWTTTTTKK